ncbi:MAG: MCP four helix bundle domain-containing protein, partial [Patescibacteria group bacterium]|nr:MCP four helix bundle domain-containing protein [Patescibacteria group bacterium]
MGWFANLNTKWKLIAGFLTVAAITACVGGIGFWGASRLAGDVEEVGSVQLPSIDSLHVIKECAENIRGTMRTLAISGISNEVRERQQGNLARMREIYPAAFATYEPLPRAPEEDKLWQQFNEQWSAWREENTKAMGMVNTVNSLIQVYDKSERSKTQSYVEAVNEAERDALNALAAFMVQLREWNNLLLRGSDLQQYDRHWAAFEAYEKTTRDGLRELQGLLRDMGLDTSSTEAVASLHAKLGDQYREAIKAYDRNEPASAMQVDQTVAGASRAVNEAFDKVVGDIAHARQQYREVAGALEAQLLGPIGERQTAAIGFLDQVVKINQDLAAQGVAEAQGMASLARYLTLGGAAVGVAMAVVFGLFLASSIAKVLATLIREGKRVAEAAVAGKLDTRGNPELVSAEFRPIITGLNETLDAVIQPLNMAAEHIDRISKGDIPNRITDTYQGDFNAIKNNLNQCIDALNGLAGDLGSVIESQRAGEITKLIKESSSRVQEGANLSRETEESLKKI